MTKGESDKHGIFLCHSSRDKDLADAFSRAASTVKPDGILLHRAELIDLEAPADGDIAKRIESSVAMFVLIGPGLIKILLKVRKDEKASITE